MNPELIFLVITSLMRVGTAARDALEQKARDESFDISTAYPVVTVEARFDEFFNLKTGLRRDLTAKPDGPLAKYWIDNAVGGAPDASTEAYDALLSALGGLKRPPFDQNTSWISLRTVDEEALTGVLAQWSRADQPLDPWARVALAVADVGLAYVGSNPGIVGTGSSGEALLKSVCANLEKWVTDIRDGTQAYFVERMAAAVMQAGLQALSDNAGIVLGDKASSDLLGAVAKPLADLFSAAVKAKDPGAQLALSNFRDTVFPQMVSAGLAALADHQQELLGSTFDPNNALGFFTKGFLQALSQEPVSALAGGDPQAWLPIYQSLLRSLAASPNLVVPGTSLDDQLFQTLIAGMATTLAGAPPPYKKDTAINLGLVVVDALQKNLPSRSKDPWVLVVPTALQAVVEGLSKSGTPIATLAQDELSAVIRVILAQAAATPGMIVGDGASVEVQAIITSVATAMAQDSKFLISEDGWMQIAGAAASAAAKNPGKLFGIGDDAPENQLAGKLISKILASASAGFKTARSGNVVLFGDTLVGAIEDTLAAAASNDKAALQNIDQASVLIDRLNKLVADPDKPIGAADWSWLFRNLIAGALATGTLDYSDDQLRKMLYDRKLPGS